MNESQPFERKGREAREDREAHEEIELEALARIIVDSGFSVHKALGPGLLESTYEHCLVHELETRSVFCKRQLALPISYKGVTLDAGYRIDLLVGARIIVEIKTVEALTRLHEAQISTYLGLSGRPLGFLMNFNVPLFKQGLRRFALTDPLRPSRQRRRRLVPFTDGRLLHRPRVESGRWDGVEVPRRRRTGRGSSGERVVAVSTNEAP